jgi:hypothetical protein
MALRRDFRETVEREQTVIPHSAKRSSWKESKICGLVM